MKSEHALTDRTLRELAATANRYHAEAQKAAGNALQAAWHAGSTLLSAKAELRHGQWLPWLDANFKGSYVLAQSYMRIASNYTVGDLHEVSIDAALKAITRPPRPDSDESDSFQKVVRTVKKAKLEIARLTGGSLGVLDDEELEELSEIRQYLIDAVLDIDRFTVVQLKQRGAA